MTAGNVTKTMKLHQSCLHPGSLGYLSQNQRLTESSLSTTGSWPRLVYSRKLSCVTMPPRDQFCSAGNLKGNVGKHVSLETLSFQQISLYKNWSQIESQSTLVVASS